MAVNYQTEIAIKQRKIQKHGVRLSYSRDPIKKAEKQIGHDSPFLVLNGDIFADVNYTEILKIHEEKSAVATIALHEVEDPSRYGVAELAENNRIKRFIEKPSLKEAPTNLINAGVYAFSPKIFEYIRRKGRFPWNGRFFQNLQKRACFTVHLYGLWRDIGKPEDYFKINKILLDPFFVHWGTIQL